MTGGGCLGCQLAASGSVFDNRLVDHLGVEATTTIVEPGAGLDLYDLRPLEPAGGFPLLVGGSGGEADCDGLRAATLELAAGLAGPWSVDVRAATPHEILDDETGELADGGRLDESSHAWVDLAAERAGDTLVVELRTPSGGALPDWIAVTASIGAPGQGAFVETAAWLPADCALAAGQGFGEMTVTGVDAIGHDSDQTVAASARRYGRGEALVLPWDVIAPANQAAMAVVEQALEFSIPTEPRPAVTDLPLPVTFAVANTANQPRTIRIEVAVPAGEFLEAWGDPLSLDPVRWELEIGAGESARRTLWLLPSPATAVIEMAYTVSVEDGAAWIELATDTLAIEIETTDRWTALRDLRISLAACADGTDDPGIRATLRDLLAALDRVALAGDDRRAADAALPELARAFAAAEDERLPCLAGLRARLADLTAMWQARWVATGGAQ